jgi:hypothetical protein
MKYNISHLVKKRASESHCCTCQTEPKEEEDLAWLKIAAAEAFNDGWKDSYSHACVERRKRPAGRRGRRQLCPVHEDRASARLAHRLTLGSDHPPYLPGRMQLPRHRQAGLLPIHPPYHIPSSSILLLLVRRSSIDTINSVGVRSASLSI